MVLIERMRTWLKKKRFIGDLTSSWREIKFRFPAKELNWNMPGTLVIRFVFTPVTIIVFIELKKRNY
jgi:hypothetical protein